MADLRNSALLESIFKQAEVLVKENACSAVTRDYLVAAAHMILLDGVRGPAVDTEIDQQEFAKARDLLSSNINREDASPNLVGTLVETWRGKEVPYTERMMVLIQKGKAMNAARADQCEQLTADRFLVFLLTEKTDAMKTALGNLSMPAQSSRQPEAKPAQEHEAHEEPAAEETPTQSLPSQHDTPTQNTPKPKKETARAGAMSIGDLALKVKALQRVLQDSVLGQAHAVGTFAAGYFQAELQAVIDRDRTRPRATFLFAGPPGVGKTFLSEEAAKALELPFRRFDMSEYNGPGAIQELTGSDAKFVGSTEGLLTGFVNEHPHCVLLFDEIEKAELGVIHLFLQVMDAGRLRDNRTDKEVTFRDTILIFTTNAGKNLYEGSASGNLAAVSREVILDALAKDMNPRTGEPYFPAAICSRFASGNVVMFNHLDAYALRGIAEKRLRKHFADLNNSMGFMAEMDDTLPTALLLAEGASADARTVKSRADAFFGSELYELFRIATSEGVPYRAENIRHVRYSVDLEHASPEIVSLFVPKERIHALVYTAQALPESPENLPIFHAAATLEDAKALIKSEDIRLVLCDMRGAVQGNGAGAFLNREDVDSPVREFLYAMLEQYPELPVLLVESAEFALTDEEKDSYLRRGVRGFIASDDPACQDQVKEAVDMIFQQQSMTELGRANQLITYETAQRLIDGGNGAEIVMFDLKLKTAIKADDSQNVLSMLSKPDMSFDDVIGAEDAKTELQYFAAYLKDPRKYKSKGVSAPKGILLYGPPGTGKTMLAKAFAAETGAVFIATEGNRFAGRYVGQGAAMVHRLFATARRYAPSVLFIDEIDTIARARTGRDTDMAQDAEQTLTALFAEMDGFATDASRPVFVLGATNYNVEPGTQMSIDPAMLRRFDRRILVDLPNAENRQLFLRRKLAEKPVFDISDEEIASISERAVGMSLAQLASVLEMAMRTFMQNQEEKIDDKALEEAFETLQSGEKKAWSTEETLRTARHEAGHTLISWLGGEKPSYVTIVSRSNYGGYMQHANQEDKMGYTRAELLARIRTSLGGRAAELAYYGEDAGVSTGASGDLRTATDIAQRMLCTYGMDDAFGLSVIDVKNQELTRDVRDAVNELLKAQLAEAVRIITEHRSAMDALVDELLKSNHLKGADIDRILQRVV